jgi:hypothetical protein
MSQIKRAVISIRGGVASVDKLDPGVEVEVVDYDVDGLLPALLDDVDGPCAHYLAKLLPSGCQVEEEMLHCGKLLPRS